MHLSYCWEKIIKPSKVSEILFVTHYYGGAAALSSLLGQDGLHSGFPANNLHQIYIFNV